MDNDESLGTAYETIPEPEIEIPRYQSDIPANESSMLTSNESRADSKSCFAQLFNFKRLAKPTNMTTRMVGIMILLFCKYHSLRFQTLDNS